MFLIIFFLYPNASQVFPPPFPPPSHSCSLQSISLKNQNNKNDKRSVGQEITRTHRARTHTCTNAYTHRSTHTYICVHTHRSTHAHTHTSIFCVSCPAVCYAFWYFWFLLLIYFTFSILGYHPKYKLHYYT